MVSAFILDGSLEEGPSCLFSVLARPAGSESPAILISFPVTEQAVTTALQVWPSHPVPFSLKQLSSA